MSNTAMTVRGREKLCKAHAGEMALPCIKWIAFGTGGVDENRQSLPTPPTCEYVCTLNKEDLPNLYLSEMGLFDEEGELVMYSTFLEKGKDDDMTFHFQTQEIF